MREPYLTQLLTGEKTAEVRRTSPRHWAPLPYPFPLYLYHRGKIHGHVMATSLYFTGFGRCAEFVKKLHKRACLSEAEMLEYLKDRRNGVIYTVEHPTRYAAPIPVPCRPQSWIYITPSILSLLPQTKNNG